jgi:hypothetical protein
VTLIMISYRRDDSEAITGRIFDRLVASYGRDAVFRDIDNIPAGSDFRDHVVGILHKCSLVVVVIGRRWLGRSRPTVSGRIDSEIDFVRIEVETALQLGVPIIPVYPRGAAAPPPPTQPRSARLAGRGNPQI